MLSREPVGVAGALLLSVLVFLVTEYYDQSFFVAGNLTTELVRHYLKKNI